MPFILATDTIIIGARGGSAGRSETQCYYVNITIANGTADAKGWMAAGESETIAVHPNDGYILPTTVEVTGTTYTWDDSEGLLHLHPTTVDVTVSIVCTAEVPVEQLDPPEIMKIGGTIYIDTEDSRTTHFKIYDGDSILATIPVEE